MKVAFDIDDTLWKVDVKNRRQVPDYDLIQVLRWFYNNGDKVFVWSGGGTEYAQMVVDQLGLTDMVTVISKQTPGFDKLEEGIKIDLAFDDAEITIAKTNVKVNRPKYE